MILHTLENEPHPDENDISLDWRGANISGISLEPSIQPQHVAALDPGCKLICHSAI